MDYKEKYEHGLECIQEILSGAGESIKTSILRKRLQPFFPELQDNQESEDEKIKEDIIALLHFGLEEGSAVAPGRNTTREQAIAWLEKQGKQKLVKTPKFWSGDKIKSKDGKQHDTVLISELDGFYKLEKLGGIYLNEDDWVFDDALCEDCTNDKGCATCVDDNIYLGVTKGTQNEIFCEDCAREFEKKGVELLDRC